MFNNVSIVLFVKRKIKKNILFKKKILLKIFKILIKITFRFKKKIIFLSFLSFVIKFQLWIIFHNYRISNMRIIKKLKRIFSKTIVYFVHI